MPHVSETCTQPAMLNDGFFANRSIFFRVATQTDPTNSGKTWVCYRVKVAGQPETAGRIDVQGAWVWPWATGIDANSRACATGSNNLVPPPHPVEAGSVGDVPFYFDVYSTIQGYDATWLCVEVGPVKQRVALNVAFGLPGVTVNTDPSPAAPQDTTPPPAGKPSSSCYEGAYGTSSELINAHLIDRDLFLYTAQPRQNEIHVCARLSGAQSGGGHLAVNASPDQIVRVDQSTDTTPCTQNVVTLSNPPTSIKISPAGQTPPSVCVNDTRYTVVTGPIPPVVSWTPDT